MAGAGYLVLKVRNWARIGGFHRIVRKGDKEGASCVTC